MNIWQTARQPDIYIYVLQMKKLRFCKKKKKQEKKVTIDDVNEKVKIFLGKEKKGWTLTWR